MNWTRPTTSADFDRAYRGVFTSWGDIRIPPEVKALIRQASPSSALELGCGVGRISRYVAQQGVRVVGVDFSSVAISKGQKRVAHDERKPQFIVGDVTHLDGLGGPFDVSIDVGCFHTLEPQSQPAYVAELSRLLRAGGTHLMWAFDASPGGVLFSPAAVKDLFAPRFELQDARKSRRRLLSSHWYWLVRA
jgi:cyclopropane fatty-acyl-phospholipid synthase-like methyltransferase